MADIAQVSNVVQSAGFDYTNIIIAVCTLIGTVLSITTILGRKFDKIDARFDKIDLRFERVDQKFDQSLDRLARIEVRVEERTLRVIHMQKKDEAQV